MNLSLFLVAIQTDFLKFGLLSLMVSGLLMGFITGVRKLFTKNKKKFFFYALCTLVLFALTAFLSNQNVMNSLPLYTFISFQVVFLALGILHVFLSRFVFPDISQIRTDFWTECIYSLVISLIGLIGFVYVVQQYKPEYAYSFCSAAIWFFIPFAVVKLYEFSISVPVPIFKKWIYPMDQKIDDPKQQELQNPRVICFEFNKSESYAETSNFRLKAPELMEFGKLFYFFINDYNDRHPESKIETTDKKQIPYQWIFYTKPNWLGVLRHIDFSKSVDANNIKENDVIICKRT